MKKLVFLSASVMSALFASQAFAVSNNTIAFQGEVTAEACSVTVNGNTAKPTILLPTVNVSALNGSGKVAGQTTFDIGVTSCGGNNITSTAISTVFTGNNVSDKGNLSNLAATDAAGNVEIQILDTKGKGINFNDGSFSGAGDLTLAAGKKEASATYTAQYYATGAATAGAVEATMQYAISYK